MCVCVCVCVCVCYNCILKIEHLNCTLQPPETKSRGGMRLWGEEGVGGEGRGEGSDDRGVKIHYRNKPLSSILQDADLVSTWLATCT